MARRKRHEEHENHERWLISYADFITLLFAFFVVMYSLSAVNEGKFRVLSDALAAAFRGAPKNLEPIPLGQLTKPEMVENRYMPHAPIMATPVTLPPKPLNVPSTDDEEAITGPNRAMREIASRIEEAMAPLIDQDLVAVKRSHNRVEIEIKSNILFPSASAMFENTALPVIQQIAGVLKEYPNTIQVEGHTDSLPIKSFIYPSNWELSAARSMSVLHLLAREGMNPARLSAVSYGQYRPVASNVTEAGRARNRRVVLVVMGTEDTAAPAPSAQRDAPEAAGGAPQAPGSTAAASRARGG
jgi:chemotaxis protein MotB